MEDHLVPNLFRTEYGKIVSVLLKYFGFDEKEVAEDIASDTFLIASETWGIRGVPEDPRRWLYRVAINKAKNHVIRARSYAMKVLDNAQASAAFNEDVHFDEENIFESQLQMMFTICHPSLSPEAQISLSLQLLFGLSIEEIANAFLSNKETIKKRLTRSKQKLREEKIKIAFPTEEQLHKRLDAVLSTVYLLFNEGYYSSTRTVSLRKHLCLEAMRLCHMLTQRHNTDTADVNALLSLMSFHSSRFGARFDQSGNNVLYDQQDRRQWDHALIMQGEYFLNKASFGNTIGKYHLEAGIAWLHAQEQEDCDKWNNILNLYDKLILIDNSPAVYLNRAFALYKVEGAKAALAALKNVEVNDNHLFHTLMALLHQDVNREKAREHLWKAFDLTSSEADRKLILDKLGAIA